MAKVIWMAMLTLSVCCLAQQTRREVVHHAANQGDDAKPNNPNVHDAQTFTAHLERVLVLRFKNNTDLLAEVNKTVQQEKVRNAPFFRVSDLCKITRFTRSGPFFGLRRLLSTFKWNFPGF